MIAGYSDYRTLSGTNLYELDLQSGQVSLISHCPLQVIQGLAFGPGDVLYAIAERNPGASYSPDDLYSVDLATGVVALIGDTGLDSLGTLAYGQNELWSYDGNSGLVKIDSVTGLATDVNPSFLGHVGLTESLSFGHDGQLYLVDSALWVMDTKTGVPVLIGMHNHFGIFGGVEFVTGAASPFTLGTLGMSGGPMGLEAWGASPHSTVAFLRANGGGGPTAVPSGNPCAGTLLDLNSSLRLVAVTATDAQGHARIGPVTVPAAAAGTLRLQALDLTTCRTSNLARVIY